MAKIRLSAITFEANHGISAAERAGTRQFEVDVSIEAPVERAEHSDALGDTIDYRQVADIVLATGTGEPHHLLESLARQMVDRLSARFPGTTIDLELRKLAPPGCAGHPQFAGVCLRKP